MITNKSVLSFYLMLTSIGLSLIFSGCEHDYYEPQENTTGSGQSLFGDSVTVPSTFTWETMRSVKVNVTVDDQYNGNYYYTVELFDSNPLFNENATLLGKGVAKKNQYFNTTVTLAKDIETIYVKQIDPTGRKKITSAAIKEGSDVNVTFVQGYSVLKSTNATESTLRSASTSSYSLRSVPSNVETVYQTPAGAIVINEQTPNAFTLSTGNSYVIRGTYTGGLQFPGEGNVSLYIEGIWNNTSSTLTLQNGTKFIVQNGGEFKTNSDLTINGYNFVIFAVAPSGKFNENWGSKVTFNFTGNGQIINTGVLNAFQMHLPSDAVLYNAGEAEIKEFTINSANNITNDKLLTITEASLTNGKITNNCNLVITQLTSNGTTISLSEGSLFFIETYTSAMGTTINLDSHSIMEVSNSVTFGSWSNTIEGNGDKTALVRLEQIFCNGWPSVYFRGNIELENSNYTSTSGSNGYTLENPASWVAKGESTVVIEATECNEGGNNNSTPVPPPANPTFPIIYEGADMTYLFEDNWPYLGDFDMNDLVLDLNPVYTINAENKVSQLQLEMTLRAVGATKGLAVGLQLDGIAQSAISHVTRSNTAGINGSVFVQSNGLESGQTYTVIPVFDDVHSALGYSTKKMINTIKGSSDTATPTQVLFTVIFNSPVEQEAVSVDKFNLFIVNGGYPSNRHEIHLSGFQPTDKADRSKFGLGDDNSNNKLYTSKDNLIWGLALPGSANYPIEWKSIRLAYPQMESWATSGGASDKNWYQNPVENLIY